MKKMYFICFFAVLCAGAAAVSALSCKQLKTAKDGLRKLESISSEQTEAFLKLEEALAVNNDCEETKALTEESLSESLSESSSETGGYIISLDGEDIVVRMADGGSLICSLKIETSLLTAQQLSMLKEGIRITNLTDVYFLLESYSS